MKKISIILLAACTVFAACSKDQQNAGPAFLTLKGTGESAVSQSAAPASASRTSLAEDGKHILWSTSDKIRVWCTVEGASSNFIATVSEFDSKTGVATFTAMTTANAPEYFAVSPSAAANDGTSPASGNARMKLPVEQSAVAGSYDPAAMSAVGYGTIPDGGTEPVLTFRNLCGLVGFTLNAGTASIDTVTITNGGAENMAACFYYTLDDNHIPSYDRTSKDTYKYIKLAGNFQNGKTYYFVVKPGTYTNPTITFHNAAGGSVSYSNEASIKVTRNSVTNIGSFTIAESDWPAVDKPEKIIATMDNWTTANKYDADTNPEGLIKGCPAVAGQGPDTLTYGAYNPLVVYAGLKSDGSATTWQLGSSGLNIKGTGSWIGLPVYEDYKLVKVDLTYGKNPKNTRIVTTVVDGEGGYLTYSGASSYAVSGGTAKKPSAAGVAATWNLSGTAANTRYYIISEGTDKHVSSIVLTYDLVESE